MVDRVKEVQRAELHKTIWRIANDLRGSVDGWDFKSYVLGQPRTIRLLDGSPAVTLHAFVEDLERVMRRAVTLTLHRRGSS
ncbi:hypothetical protein AB0O34_25305 [Sphaerisporangium sp. NPDC088356]|uniref:hypothetical protein n=1 Tax=Sphaerisporangium sp. NPDC088356 TaxID=3154871 RepID=UPI00341D0B0B